MATVKVEALAYHTYNGQAYQVGEIYDIDEQYADSVAQQGKAVRMDRVARAQVAVKDAEQSRAAASHPVAPMGIDMGVAAKPTRKGKTATIATTSLARKKGK